MAGDGLALIKPDADALRAAVQTALDGPELRLQARRLAQEIAAMPTIDDVVDAMVGLT